MRGNLSRIAALAALLLGLPLAGVHLAGRPLAPYLEFPPRTQDVAQAPFSWIAFSLLAVAILLCVGPFLWRLLAAPARSHSEQAPRSFPWWGWVGLLWTGLAWIVAWNRFEWMGSWQAHTFTPLWLGYILVVNAWTEARTRQCLMRSRPRVFLWLFPLSAVFWWFFEYLNRFVENWHYPPVWELTAWEYIWYATLPFSTVLPAVLSTTEWLSTWPRFDAAFRRLWQWDWVNRPITGWVGLIAAALGLFGIGLWPDYLFPLVWVAPLLLLMSMALIRGEDTILSGLRTGDWRPVCQPAFAALVCGFFWELWNVKSLAHWEYAIPYVQCCHLFEMPILGYAGYLPFGLECAVVAGLIEGKGSRNVACHGTDAAQRKPMVAER